MVFSGKRAVVTDAASGIGRALAIASAQAGATVHARDVWPEIESIVVDGGLFSSLPFIPGKMW